MVITSNNVIHVGRVLRAALATVRVEPGASVTVAPQDALAYATPVSRETTSPIRTGPLRHSAVTASTWITKRPRPCKCRFHALKDMSKAMDSGLYRI